MTTATDQRHWWPFSSSAFPLLALLQNFPLCSEAFRCPGSFWAFQKESRKYVSFHSRIYFRRLPFFFGRDPTDNTRSSSADYNTWQQEVELLEEEQHLPTFLPELEE